MLLTLLETGLTKLNKLLEKLLSINIIIMFIVLMIQIFSRFIFFIPLPWSQDVLVFLLLVTAFLGAGLAVAAKRHIAVELLVGYLPKKAEQVILIIADAISIVLIGILIYQSIILGKQSIGILMGASPIPADIYYWVVAFGCFAMMYNYLIEMIKKIMNIGGK